MEREIFRGKFVRVVLEEREGRTYERVRWRDGVSVIPITDTGCIRFIREYDYAHQRTRVKLVTGHIEDGESSLEAAQRELREELGLTADRWEEYSRSELRASIEKTQYFFLASGLHEGPSSPDAGERIEGTVDVPLAEVHERTLRGEFGTTWTGFTLLKLAYERLGASLQK